MPQIWILMARLITCGYGSNLSLQPLNMNWEGANKAKWDEAYEEKGVAGQKWEKRTAACFPKTIIFFSCSLAICNQNPLHLLANLPVSMVVAYALLIWVLGIKAFLSSQLPRNHIYGSACFFSWSYIVVIFKSLLVMVHTGIHKNFAFLKVIFLKCLSVFCNVGFQMEFSHHSQYSLYWISNTLFWKENWYPAWCDLSSYSWELLCCSITILLPILFHYFIQGCLKITK